SAAVALDSVTAPLSLLVMTASELDGVVELESGVAPELLELSSPQAAKNAQRRMLRTARENFLIMLFLFVRVL
ncbi:MAG: hypothetical protein IKM72_14975, partial [Oscillospiraceae bacterium]|nr:hypothetical protein [Oscillospiraceae bacterium]